jgi:hypothetical protein
MYMLKRNASLWWEKLQLEKENIRKEKIKTWDTKVEKLKIVFLIDYAFNMSRRLQNLK